MRLETTPRFERRTHRVLKAKRLRVLHQRASKCPKLLFRRAIEGAGNLLEPISVDNTDATASMTYEAAVLKSSDSSGHTGPANPERNRYEFMGEPQLA